MSGDDDVVSVQFVDILAQMKKLDIIEAKLQNLEIAHRTQQLTITRLESTQTITAMADVLLGVPRAPPWVVPNERPHPRYYKLDFPTFDDKSDCPMGQPVRAIFLRATNIR